MLVKSKMNTEHLDDIRETFNTLRKYKRKLNLAKFTFEVSLGKFLDFMVSQRGIEPNPEKVKVILEMISPKTMKEVQRLMGRVIALNKFVSKAIDKCLPFFKTLKQAFKWTEECKTAFKNLKEYLARPLLLSPLVKENTCFYTLQSLRWL